jgi:hypothetical protein
MKHFFLRQDADIRFFPKLCYVYQCTYVYGFTTTKDKNTHFLVFSAVVDQMVFLFWAAAQRSG